MTTLNERLSRNEPAKTNHQRFPEARALRILFYPRWVRGAYFLAWAVTILMFLSLMTYRSLRPLDALDVTVAVGMGGLIPLVLILGFHAHRVAMGCHVHLTQRASSSPALALSLFATAASCMCCLPVIPILLTAMMAGSLSAAQIGGWSAVFTASVPWLYLASTILLLWSLHRNSRSLVDSVDTADRIPESRPA